MIVKKIINVKRVVLSGEDRNKNRYWSGVDRSNIDGVADRSGKPVLFIRKTLFKYDVLSKSRQFVLSVTVCPELVG